MRRHGTLLLFLMLSAGAAQAQKINNVWAFGVGAGLDFTGAPPAAVTNSLNTESGCAAVSSYGGSLLFYTNGATIWDRNHNPMPNGIGLTGYGPAATAGQGVLIVPVINDTNKYYVFTKNTNLYYSIVDLSLNSGTGDIAGSDKNIVVGDEGDLGDAFVSVPGEGCSIWVITHRTATKEFLAYKVTESGVDGTPVISTVGTYSGNLSFETGYLKASKGGDKLVISSFTVSNTTNPANATPSFIEMFNFDQSTGVVSNPVIVDTIFDAFRNFLSACFSPDGTKVYAASPFLPLLGAAGVNQYDITSGNTAAIVASKTGVGNTPFASDLQTGPDNKIYVSCSWGIPGNTLDCISDPDVTGTGCNYTASAVTLQTGSIVKASLPTIVVMPLQDTISNTYPKTICTGYTLPLHAPSGFFRYYFQGQMMNDTVFTVNAPGTYYVSYENHCVHHVDTFQVTLQDLNLGLPDTSLCGYDFQFDVDASTGSPTGASYLWQDQSTSPLFTVTAPGTYWVKVSTESCSQADTFEVIAVPTPSFSLGDDVTICLGEALVLTPSINADHYRWQDGNTGKSYTVNQTGSYSLELEKDGCKASDEVKVTAVDCECDYYIPNAFSPNNDGLNDHYNPIIKCGALETKFRISIYNRWGERVFHSQNMAQTWDGTYNGKPCDAGTYFYVIDISNRVSEKNRKGDLLLIR